MREVRFYGFYVATSPPPPSDDVTLSFCLLISTFHLELVSFCESNFDLADLQSKNIRISSAFLNRSSLHLISAMFVELQELNLGCFWVLKISRMRSDIVEQIIICEIDIAPNVLSEN